MIKLLSDLIEQAIIISHHPRSPSVILPPVASYVNIANREEEDLPRPPARVYIKSAVDSIAINAVMVVRRVCGRYGENRLFIYRNRKTTNACFDSATDFLSRSSVAAIPNLIEQMCLCSTVLYCNSRVSMI